MDNLKSVKAHSLIFKEGVVAEKLFLVKQGEVLCLKSSKDRLIPVFMAKAGDILGESAILKELDYTYSAISYTAAELVEIPHSTFNDVMNESPDWLQELTATMISRFQSTASLIADNRLIHSSIISEEEFTSEMEIEFKRLINQ